MLCEKLCLCLRFCGLLVSEGIFGAYENDVLDIVERHVSGRKCVGDMLKNSGR